MIQSKRLARLCGLMGLSVVVIALSGIMSKQAGPSQSSLLKMEELPDSLVGDPQAIRQALLKDANEGLQEVPRRLPENPVARCNCLVATQRLAMGPDAKQEAPLAIAAWLQNVGGKPALLLWALNMRRETNQVIVAFITPDGRLLKVIRHFRIPRKFPDLLDRFGIRVEFSPVEDLVAKATATPSGELVLALDAETDKVIALPEGRPLAVGVGDRNGAESNFVTPADKLSAEGKKE